MSDDGEEIIRRRNKRPSSRTENCKNRKRSASPTEESLYDSSLMASESKKALTDSTLPLQQRPAELVAAKRANGFSNQFAGKKTINPTKKLVIKNLKDKPTLPEGFHVESWNHLHNAVTAIFTQQTSALTNEQLYQMVENLVSQNFGAYVYDELRKSCDSQIAAYSSEFAQQNCDGEQFLKKMHQCWNAHCDRMLMIRSIFLFLDRTFVPRSTGLLPIWDFGLLSFREHVVENQDLQVRLLNGVFELISRDRNGDVVDRQLLRTLLKMLVTLGVYSTLFEKRFLDETRQVYVLESSKAISEMEVPDYLQHVNRRIQEESHRATTYLDFVSRSPLLALVEQLLITDHVQTILNKGLESMLLDHKITDLALLYRLFKKAPTGLKELRVAFVEYIKKIGWQIVSNPSNDPEKDKDMVQHLLDFKDRIDEIQSKSFENNQQYHNAVRDAFENCINKRPNKPAELIAKYIDQKLKAGNRELTEEDLERIMDKALVLFRFIHGKDVFEAFYKKDLAKRLLVGRSASDDAERAMLLRLKQECGGAFTSKLEGMFKDIEVSRDLMHSFKQHLNAVAPNAQIEMTVTVLTMGHWPPSVPVPVNLPTEMADLQEIFQRFYCSKNSGRRLQWQATMGHCVVKADFGHPGGKKELEVSVFQALCLLLFNEADELSYKDIAQRTNIVDLELKRTLQSLACGKSRVLEKKPASKDVEDSDNFVFNSEFKHKLFKIKINQVQLKETAEEQEETEERVFQDRQYQIDAAIVRIMKMRKSLPHNQLLAELYSQLQFALKAADVKKRIESLIEREYMERDKENSSLYHYLA